MGLMSDVMVLSAVAAGGFFLGIVYFGGLWLTVKKSIFSKRAAIWLLSSMIVRTAITLAGFYLISAGNWQRMLLSLGGFIAARVFFIRITDRKGQKEADSCI
jgi:F1F0 ATPase subunit 2